MKRFLFSPSILMLLLSACATVQPSPVAPTSAPAKPAATTAPVVGGTFVRAMTSEPGQIDPQGAPNSGLSLTIPYLFDTLVARDVNNKLLPLLAESWQVSDEGRVITIKLKSGVKFQDGTPMDADSVVLTFTRFKKTGQKSPIYQGIQIIDKVEVVDSLTVRFSFKDPAANFWSTISLPYAGIISPASAKKVDEAGGKGQLIGTGPFMLGEWKAGQSITLKRNPDYAWGAALTENRGAPYVDALVFKVLPEADTQFRALQAGDVDAMFINDPAQRDMLAKDPSMKLQDAVLNSMIYLGYNTKKDPFTDKAVRQALSYAVNKDEILKVALGGIGMVAHAPLPPSLPGYDDSLRQYELGYDPRKAQELLKQAGFARGSDGVWAKDSKPLKGMLLTSNRAPNDSIAAVLQSEFKAIGVPIEIQQLDSKAVMDATNKGQFDLLLWRYDWNDPDALNIYLGSANSGSTNRVFYSNPDVDRLLQQGARELDEATRIKYYVDAQKIILQDAPWQPLYVPLDVLAWSSRVEGIKLGYMGRMLVNDARVVNKQAK